MVKEEDIKKDIKEMLESIQGNLAKKADDFFKERISEAKTLKELKDILEKKGGFVKANWCGKTDCADIAKSETNGGTVKGTLFGKEEKAHGKCVVCGDEAKEVVYFAKSY